jgi:hypothetical protein
MQYQKKLKRLNLIEFLIKDILIQIKILQIGIIEIML